MSEHLVISSLPDHVGGDVRLLVPLRFRRGTLREDERRSIESAILNLKGIALRTGMDDWSRLRVLDYGCGVKFTQALIQFDLPVGRYVGMDVYEGLISYLNEAVSSDRFSYHHVPFRNAMYNRNGLPLSAINVLPGPSEPYDLITLQSVFTHFAPDDFASLLQVLRRYSTDGTRLLFTCFIDDDMDVDFLDSVPDRPLLRAVYRSNVVRDMVHGAGWEILSVHEPSFAMQHQFVCSPR